MSGVRFGCWPAATATAESARRKAAMARIRICAPFYRALARGFGQVDLRSPEIVSTSADGGEHPDALRFHTADEYVELGITLIRDDQHRPRHLRLHRLAIRLDFDLGPLILRLHLDLAVLEVALQFAFDLDVVAYVVVEAVLLFEPVQHARHGAGRADRSGSDDRIAWPLPCGLAWHVGQQVAVAVLSAYQTAGQLDVVGCRRAARRDEHCERQCPCECPEPHVFLRSRGMQIPFRSR